MRPTCMEVRTSDAVDDGFAHAPVIGGRVFNTGVIFCTVSVPHLVVRVYHISIGIEVVGIEGQKMPTARGRGR